MENGISLELLDEVMVKVTGLLVPPGVVTVTFRELVSAAVLIVKVAVKLVELATVIAPPLTS